MLPWKLGGLRVLCLIGNQAPCCVYMTSQLKAPAFENVSKKHFVAEATIALLQISSSDVLL